MIDVTDQAVTGESAKFGKVTGISIAATGIVTAPVTFTNAFPNALDYVGLQLADPSATGASFDAPYITGDTKSGFTINLNVRTAAAAGTTISCYWQAYGN